MIFAQTQPAQVSPLGALLPLILIFFIFYFLLILPQQRKQKQHKKMLDEIKEGDKVITIGGAMGTVNKLKDNIVTIEFKDGVKIDFVKSAISQVMKSQG
ncbi:MAG: preprotein translocase subunit YajC [Candidatus Ratteibacteria bacterium]|nr:preprotein translocase subunit YajC [Candidatus Ratteibacteria bacterium]